MNLPFVCDDDPENQPGAPTELIQNHLPASFAVCLFLVMYTHSVRDSFCPEEFII